MVLILPTLVNNRFSSNFGKLANAIILKSWQSALGLSWRWKTSTLLSSLLFSFANRWCRFQEYPPLFPDVAGGGHSFWNRTYLQEFHAEERDEQQSDDERSRDDAVHRTLRASFLRAPSRFQEEKKIGQKKWIEFYPMESRFEWIFSVHLEVRSHRQPRFDVAHLEREEKTKNDSLKLGKTR